MQPSLITQVRNDLSFLSDPIAILALTTHLLSVRAMGSVDMSLLDWGGRVRWDSTLWAQVPCPVALHPCNLSYTPGYITYVTKNWLDWTFFLGFSCPESARLNSSLVASLSRVWWSSCWILSGLLYSPHPSPTRRPHSCHSCTLSFYETAAPQSSSITGWLLTHLRELEQCLTWFCSEFAFDSGRGTLHWNCGHQQPVRKCFGQGCASWSDVASASSRLPDLRTCPRHLALSALAQLSTQLPRCRPGGPREFPLPRECLSSLTHTAVENTRFFSCIFSLAPSMSHPLVKCRSPTLCSRNTTSPQSSASQTFGLSAPLYS